MIQFLFLGILIPTAISFFLSIAVLFTASIGVAFLVLLHRLLS